jgi:hypothetical protein
LPVNILTGTSRVPAVVDYLVAAFTAATTLGGASPPVAVYDGPVATRAPEQLLLWVGLGDPDSGGMEVGAESTQEWVGAGSVHRNEHITVHCAAESWSGGTDVRTERLAAFAIVAAVEDILRRDASLGGLVLFVNPGVTDLELSQNNTNTGAIARVAFTITAKARIGGP